MVAKKTMTTIIMMMMMTKAMVMAMAMGMAVMKGYIAGRHLLLIRFI